MINLTKGPSIAQQVLDPESLRRLPEVRQILTFPRTHPLGKLNATAKLRGGTRRTCRRGMLPNEAPIFLTN